MYENTSITFSKKNIIIAFDDIECDRTASFTIPATSKNDAALGLAKDFHFYGQAMRSRVSAQMVDGTVVKDGIFCVTGYEDGAYDCTFVYGENLELKRIQDLGTVDTYTSAWVTALQKAWTDTFDSVAQNFGFGVYYNQWSGRDTIAQTIDHPRAYFKFSYILGIAAQRAGITIASLPAVVDQLYIVMKSGMKNYLNGDAEFGDNITIRYNIPKWTLVDMLKIAASVSGSLLNIDGSTVKFLNSAVITQPSVDISGKLLAYGKLRRVVGNGAQSNTIQFDKAEEISSPIVGADPIIADFQIYNENIEAHKVLYTLKGIVVPKQLPDDYYGGVASAVSSRSLDKDGRSFDVGYWSDYMAVTPFVIPQGKNLAGKLGLKPFVPQIGSGFDFIERIYNESTQLDVSVRMSHLEFEEIKPDTLLHLNGSDFIWIEMQYSNGVATLTLAKI